MNGKDAIRLMSEWLFNNTGDDGVKKEEVLDVIFSIYANGKPIRGWKGKLKRNLDVGYDFVVQFLVDKEKMGQVEFWNKYYK